MSGGVWDAAVEGRTAESLPSAESAFTWLGLESVAQMIADVRSEIDPGAEDGDERAEQLELSADERYNALITPEVALHLVKLRSVSSTGGDSSARTGRSRRDELSLLG